MPIFTIVDFPNKGDTYGRITGAKPHNAANKALTILLKKIQLKNSDEFIVFTLKDITPNNTSKNTGKQYKYIGSRVLLETPKKINIGGKEIIFKYRNIIAKYYNNANK